MGRPILKSNSNPKPKKEVMAKPETIPHALQLLSEKTPVAPPPEVKPAPKAAAPTDNLPPSPKKHGPEHQLRENWRSQGRTKCPVKGCYYPLEISRRQEINFQPEIVEVPDEDGEPMLAMKAHCSWSKSHNDGKQVIPIFIEDEDGKKTPARPSMRKTETK